MANATLNLGIYTPTELQALLIAAKAEYLRFLGGRVQQGSSAAQSYGLTQMDGDALIRLLNALGDELGMDNPTLRVTPNFNTHRNGLPNQSAFGAWTQS